MSVFEGGRPPVIDPSSGSGSFVTDATAEAVEFITIIELAELARVSQRTAQRYVAEGILPQPKRLGKRLVRWDKGEVLRALNELPRRVA